MAYNTSEMNSGANLLSMCINSGFFFSIATRHNNDVICIFSINVVQNWVENIEFCSVFNKVILYET